MEEHAEDGFKALINPRVLFMALCYVGFPLAAYGLSYWLPTIVKSFGVSNTANGFINIIPRVIVAVALFVVPLAADKAKQNALYRRPCLRRRVLPADVGAAQRSGIAVCLPLHRRCGHFAGQPVFWNLPGRFLKGSRCRCRHRRH